MFRNQYDNDITTFSPQGRLHQIEYAMEAVKQGAATIGLRSKSHVVLVSVKRTFGELASYQKKIYRIDDHLAISIAGLMSDARVLSMFMRNEALKSRMIYGRPLPVQRIVAAISDKAQKNTQQYGGRPYGVGLLVAGIDETGPRLFEFSPSGNFFEYEAMAIGARSQSARTWLEKHVDSFKNMDVNELVMHGLRALRDTLQQDKDLNVLNTSIGIVSEKGFQMVEGEQLEEFVKKIEQEPKRQGRVAAVPETAPMEEDAPPPVVAEEEKPTPMDVE